MGSSQIHAQVRLACVFGNLGNEAILVTESDEAWALGSNGAGCLGLGDMASTLVPRKVEGLCNKVSVLLLLSCALKIFVRHISTFYYQELTVARA